jgi:hypothetical protein
MQIKQMQFKPFPYDLVQISFYKDREIIQVTNINFLGLGIDKTFVLKTNIEQKYQN